jgi:type I restriction enzyme, S subunit
MAKQQERRLPEGWQWVKLGDVAGINPTRSRDLNREDDVLTTFVPMPAIDAQLGTINRSESKPFGEVKKGYTYFEENDVLFAKITPCMENGKHAIARNLKGGFGFGSTEFHVIRPSQAITPEWIHFFLRQPRIGKDATSFFTGSVGQQRVPKEFLANLTLPLPPIAEQKRLVAILNDRFSTIETIRKAIEDQLEAINALPATLLRQAFNGEL